MWKKTQDGIIIPLRVTPKAGRNEIIGWDNGELKIKVTACPEKGNANSAVIALLSKTLKIGKSRITLVSGSTSRQKQFLIADIDEESIKKCLPAL